MDNSNKNNYNSNEREDFNRPLDLLFKSKRKKVIIELKTGEVLEGKLVAFDVHLNVVLTDAKMFYEDSEESYKNVFLRGDNILLIRDF